MANAVNKILIIDSNKSFYRCYRRKLLSLHANITFIANLKELNSLIDFTQFNFILVSHIFKDSNGVEIYNFLREKGYSGNIIIVTSERDSIVKNYYLNGITGILDKTLNSEDFVDYLSRKIPSYFTFRSKFERQGATV